MSITTVLKEHLIKNIGPLRRLKERITGLERDLAVAHSEVVGLKLQLNVPERLKEHITGLERDLAVAHSEVVGLKLQLNVLKRQLNLVGDQNKLYESFADATSECSKSEGYDDAALSRFIVSKSSMYIRQLEDDRPIALPDHVAQSVLVSLLVGQQRRSLRVIDFGGGCAVPFALLRRLCQDKIDADWHVVEVPTLVSLARTSIAIPLTTFSDSLDQSVDRLRLGGVDLVHTAGTLQHVDDPRKWLKRLLAVNAKFIFFGRVAFTAGNTDVIGIQRSRVRDHGVQLEMDNVPEGNVEYPFTYMPESEFKSIVADAGYDLVATFESSSGYRPINEHHIVGGGFLYRQR